jgi:signal transduction histidine kinase/ligand-binding sensor domain-containing protein
MNRTRILIVVLLIGLSILETRAQYRFDNWTTDDGLPQNSVYAIVQTRDNYIWLATLDGLARFDGVRFTVFNKSNSPGISNNRFVYLYEDVNGDLWAGTEQSGVVRLHDGQFTSYGIEQGLTSLRVVWLSGDSNGNVIVYPPGMNPAVTWSGEKFVPAEPSVTSAPVPPAASRSIFCGRDDTEIGCYVGGVYQRFPYSDGFPDFNLSFFYNSARDSDGSIWIPSTDSRLLKVDTDRSFREYTPRDGLPDFPIRMITGGPRSGLLASNKDGSLWLTDVATMQNHLLTPQAPETILQPTEVRAAFEDRESNIWFGTTRGGLFRVKKQFITAYSKAQGLTENNVYPVYQDRRGVVWMGTTRGLFKYQDGTFSQVKDAPAGDINAISEDHAGRVLISDGQFVWAIENDRVARVFEAAPQLRVIFALHEQDDGTLWLGGQGGLARLKDGVAQYYTTNDGLAGDEVKVIIGDGSGGMWIGSYGGLTHYKDGQFTKWRETDGLPTHTIRSLYQDSDGVLWIGTYDGGLARFKDGRFTAYSIKNGLHNDGVFQILQDNRNNFWIISNRGIYRVSKDELNEFAAGRRSSVSSIAYGKSDGMLNVECNGGRSPAGVKTSDGKLWFPTQDGVAVIDPENVTVNPNPPPVAIEGIKIDNQPVAVEKMLLPAAIEIDSTRQNFEIEYTALSFINSENTRFKYRLEGLQNDWVEAGTRRTAYYSFVPPGEYTFRVIAANSDGVWNEEGKSLRIKVLPPFYKTWWFLTLAALGVGGLAYSAFKLRLNQVENARRSQEEFSRKLLASQEQERQRIAAEMHDSLGQSLLIIKNRIALAQADIEKRDTVEEQLNELSDSASSAIDECREIAYNLRPFQISRFGLVKTLQGIFSRIGEVKPVEVFTEIDDIDHLLTDEAEINLFRIVQECSNNIIKHSNATEASLKIKRDNTAINVWIRDNGRGFDPMQDGQPDTSSGGFGLVGMAERVRMLDGEYSVKSAPGRGTAVRITLRNFRKDDARDNSDRR